MERALRHRERMVHFRFILCTLFVLKLNARLDDEGYDYKAVRNETALKIESIMKKQYYFS